MSTFSRVVLGLSKVSVYKNTKVDPISEAGYNTNKGKFPLND